MQKKNVKGYIGLFLGLASIILILAACFFPMTKLTGFGLDGKMSFFGTPNVIMIWSAIGCAVFAIIFGAMSKKDADKKGPRKPGVIIGIICIILGLLASLVVGFMTSVTEFINSEGETGMIAELINDNKDVQKTMDDLLRAMQKAAGVEEKGFPKYSENNESSKTAADETSDNTEASVNTAE